jgi:hypothetical protein
MACDIAGPDKDQLLAQHGGNAPKVRGRLPQPYLTSPANPSSAREHG